MVHLVLKLIFANLFEEEYKHGIKMNISSNSGEFERYLR